VNDRWHNLEKNAVYLQNVLVFVIYLLVFTIKWWRDKGKEK